MVVAENVPFPVSNMLNTCITDLCVLLFLKPLYINVKSGLSFYWNFLYCHQIGSYHDASVTIICIYVICILICFYGTKEQKGKYHHPKAQYLYRKHFRNTIMMLIYECFELSLSQPHGAWGRVFPGTTEGAVFPSICETLHVRSISVCGNLSMYTFSIQTSS